MSSRAEVQERESEVVNDFDRDSLHTLPLSMIPLDTPGLRRARMIKNARYESVVELFKGEGTGSGQVSVDQLTNVFRELGEGDLAVLGKLSELPSYDIYSLRIMLREQDIPVNDYDELRLSGGKQRELDQYMGRSRGPSLCRSSAMTGRSRNSLTSSSCFVSRISPRRAPSSISWLRN